MTEHLQPRYCSQGWRQFLSSRKEMLDKYDKARETTKAHEVEVEHGRVAEAVFRDWLKGFLPKRYGITSGFIVSAGLTQDHKLPQYDVIIYDQLESPVLWLECSPDVTEGGTARAIPVEYVLSVLEVKASMSSTTVKKAIEHLRDLTPLMGIDNPDTVFKVYLPPQFSCGLVFFELRDQQVYCDAALSSFVHSDDLRGFFGGVILRAECHDLPYTAVVYLAASDEPLELNSETDLSRTGLSHSIQVNDGTHRCGFIRWGEDMFSRFAFDQIARLKGQWECGGYHSLYGVGTTYEEDFFRAGPNNDGKTPWTGYNA